MKLLNDTGIYHFDQIANLSDDEIKALKERRDEITGLLGRDNFNVELFGDGSIITANIDEILKNFTESIKTTKEQLEELTDQQRLDKVRDDIQAQFKEDLDERRRLKREEFNSDFTGLAKVAAFQKSNENAVKRLRDEVNASKAEELKLTGSTSYFVSSTISNILGAASYWILDLESD